MRTIKQQLKAKKTSKKILCSAFTQTWNYNNNRNNKQENSFIKVY